MAILGVSHVALGVYDMDRAVGFYRDVIGMTVVRDWMQTMAAQDWSGLSGDRTIVRRCVWLRQGEAIGTFSLALDEMVQPRARDARAALFDAGFHHLSFWVDDIDAIMSRADEHGHAPIMPHVAEAKEYGEVADSQIRSVFFQDPDGNYVQCDQRI